MVIWIQFFPSLMGDTISDEEYLSRCKEARARFEDEVIDKALGQALRYEVDEHFKSQSDFIEFAQISIKIKTPERIPTSGPDVMKDQYAIDLVMLVARCRKLCDQYSWRLVGVELTLEKKFPWEK